MRPLLLAALMAALLGCAREGTRPIITYHPNDLQLPQEVVDDAVDGGTLPADDASSGRPQDTAPDTPEDA